jgi:dolichol-phosphate mannosyltransferase
VDALQSLHERARFIRGLVEWIGFEQTSVTYRADARPRGSSKYCASKLLRFGARATIEFSSLPLYMVAAVGLVLALASFLYGMFAIAAKLFANVPIIGWVSVLTAVTFLGGVQLISLGLIGAYVGQIYEEAKGRPTYLVRRAYGFACRDGRGERAPGQAVRMASADPMRWEG